MISFVQNNNNASSDSKAEERKQALVELRQKLKAKQQAKRAHLKAKRNNTGGEKTEKEKSFREQMQEHIKMQRFSADAMKTRMHQRTRAGRGGVAPEMRDAALVEHMSRQLEAAGIDMAKLEAFAALQGDVNAVDDEKLREHLMQSQKTPETPAVDQSEPSSSSGDNNAEDESAVTFGKEGAEEEEDQEDAEEEKEE